MLMLADTKGKNPPFFLNDFFLQTQAPNPTFAELEAVAGDYLIIESGPNAGRYRLTSVNDDDAFMLDENDQVPVFITETDIIFKIEKMTIIGVPDSFDFRTAVTKLSIPEYDDLYDLASLPGGWSSFGTVNFQPSGMTCQAAASGITTSTNKLLYGILIDVNVVGSQSVGEAKIIEIYDADNRKVSVFADFLNKEVWIGDGIITPRQNFKPLLKETSFFLRLTTHLIDGKLIARIYTSKIGAVESPLLQQTVELVEIPDSPDIGSGIVIGRITGSDDIEFSDLGILAGEDPDKYYPFPTINEILPLTSELSGGNNLSVILDELLDVELGSESLENSDTINTSTTGGGTASIATGKITLGSSGIGRSEAQFVNSFSGDVPGGADISISLEIDQDLIDTPLQQTMILAAAELRAAGQMVAIELVTDPIEQTYFRIVSKTETVTLLSSVLLTTNSNSHIVRFVRGGAKLIILINGTEVINLIFKDGVGLFKTYIESLSAAANFETHFTDFIVKPVLLVGENVADV